MTTSYRLTARGWAGLAVTAIAAVLGACAAPQTYGPRVDSVSAELEAKKQRELAVGSYIEQSWRLQDVGYPILTNGADLCGDMTAPLFGIFVWNSSFFTGEWADTGRSLYGLTDVTQIAHVVPGSPAARAGIRDGDIPVAVNGWQVPVDEKAPAELIEKIHELSADGEPLTFQMSRNGERATISVAPVRACKTTLILDPKDEKNAFADGKRIVMLRGMMDFFRSDEELAVVISHELAHNAMGHSASKAQNAVVGGLLGAVFDVMAAVGGVNTQGQFTKLGSNAGAQAYSVAFEQEADYVGLYLMARGGYDISHAADFWRRMAVADPKSIKAKTTHPTTPERFVALERTVEEIKTKRANQAPVFPDRKPESQVAAPDTAGARD